MKTRIYIGLFLTFSLAIGGSVTLSSQNLHSPNKKLRVELTVDKSTSFSVHLNNKPIIDKVSIDLIFNNQSVFETKKYSTERALFSDTVLPVVAFKDKKIHDKYNLMRLDFENGVSLEFRAYNNGIAYRYITYLDKIVDVNEKVSYYFSRDYTIWTSLTESFYTSYEGAYTKLNISKFPADTMSHLPILFDCGDGNKILITDADVYDYPHTFLKKGAEKNILEAIFPPYPLESELIGFRRSKITKEADYIAKTSAKRYFPWRVMIITENDAQLVKSELVYLLSRENIDKDTDWIKPGRVAWDWWNASNLYGVDFKAGLNTASWKYYIDFASENDLEYIILDGGWSVNHIDITTPNANLNLHEVINYGKKKNVRIILWTSWSSLNKMWSALDKYQQWGIAGIKVDFMERSDQWMVNYYEKVAKEAYARKLLVDFHGAYKPCGLRRQYPNVMTYEGVKGLEHCKWANLVTPKHDVTIPFIRMVCGPMDYTPGAMRNFHSEEFEPNFKRPCSQGTRAHQVALFVLYESGIQMFADSPSNYEREQETTDFIAQIPVVWDELKVLEAKVGEYLILARRSGDKWFVGGITNNIEREFDIDLSFLENKEYSATIYIDGKNADNFAEDYDIFEQKVNRNSKINIKMAKGGGFAIKIE